jgi:hypothetical protein
MSNETKQTAVDITFKKLASLGLLVTRDYKNLIAYREAKAMEKEQIKDAYNDGHTDGVTAKPGLTSGTMYYNETYEGGNK